MAGLFCEGFEWLGSGTDLDDATEWLDKFLLKTEIGTGATAAFATSRTGYQGIQLTSASERIETANLREPDDANTTLVFGFYVKTGTAFANLQDWIYILCAENIQCSFEMNSDGTVDFQRGTSTILGTSSYAFSTNNEYYVEFKIVIADGTSGSMEMKVADLTADGDDAETQSEWTVSSVDTRGSSDAFETSWTRVQFRGMSSTGTTIYDDIVIMDGSGLVNNDFQGNVIVEAINPDGAGNSTQLTPSAGSNFQNVDETTIPDGDTTYNTADADAELDLYTMEDLSETGDVVMVQLQALARVTEGDPRKCRLAVRSGGSNSEGSDVTFTSEFYTGRFRVMDENTNGGGAWTTATVDALECGFKRQS